MKLSATTGDDPRSMSKVTFVRFSFKSTIFLIFLLFILAGTIIAAYLINNPLEIQKDLGAFAGDCNADSKVDIIDFQLLSNSFGKAQGQTGYYAGCDFNGDNAISILDYQSLSNNFGRTSVTNTPTPRISASITPTPVGKRVIKYFGVDRGNPITDTNYSVLSQHAAKTIVVDTDINAATSVWQSIIDLSSKYNFNVVIWPSDWKNSNWPNCGWEPPYVKTNPSDYIYRIKPLLNYLFNSANWPNGNIRVIGIVNAHEPFTVNGAPGSCYMTPDEMAAIRSQIINYVSGLGHTIKVWAYIDNVYDRVKAGDIARIMDVAVTWQHCFGGAEGSCPSAQQRIINDRNFINSTGLDGKVDLVYLFQTFAQGSGYRMPTATEMHDWSCSFLGTNGLDGFLWYTWGACWYSSDLWCPASTHPNQNLWPQMNSVYDSCVTKN